MTGPCRIITGDCRHVLPTLEAGSVDVVIADPPYGDTSLEWDRKVSGWSKHLMRLLKPGGSLWVWHSLRYFADVLGELQGWSLAQDVVWEKHNGSNFHADRFRRVHELASHWYYGRWSNVYKSVQTTPDATKRAVRRKARPAHTGNIGEASYASVDGGPRLMRSVMHVRSCHGKAIHPTQKPIGVLMPLIEYSCPVGGTVLDPFAGSGSTGEAATLTGRSFIGIEIDPDMAARATRRLGAIVPLFAGGHS
ncbi:MAG: site-specific DNA-methyltransferase [Phycisphaerales bacterium]|nr:site-specific DNA-methyltransferase [Phycisphaerales bacterium]